MEILTYKLVNDDYAWTDSDDYNWKKDGRETQTVSLIEQKLKLTKGNEPAVSNDLVKIRKKNPDVVQKGNLVFAYLEYQDTPVVISGSATNLTFYNDTEYDFSEIPESYTKNIRYLITLDRWQNYYYLYTFPRVDATWTNVRVFPSFYMKSIDTSNWDTSNIVDMSTMFSGCTLLSSLDLSGLDTSNVTDMGSMFNQCYNLKTLDLSGLDVSKVTDMGSMFENCSKLTSLNVSGWNTSNVTDMISIFRNCSSLESLDLSNFDTSKVTSMYSMFYECYNLKTLDVSGFDTSNVTTMKYMFYDCRKITSLDLSSFDTSKVTNMEGMFYDCSSLEYLDLSNFKASSATNMNYMFDGCSKLKHIKCKQAFKDKCFKETNNYLELPDAMKEGGSGTWEII